MCIATAAATPQTKATVSPKTTSAAVASALEKRQPGIAR
jgi:hypothetical protein